MATHNNSSLAAAAIVSVVSNMPDNCELIVVNDGSTDDSDEIIRTLIKKFPQVRYFYEAKKGVSSARNKGIDLSLGEYITFIDGDDLYSDDFFKIMIPLIESYQYDIIAYESTRDPDIFLNTDKKIDSKIETNYQAILEKTFRSSHWQVWSRVFRKSIVARDRFPENLCYYEDAAFTPYQYLKSNTLCKINNIIYYYRKNRFSVTETHKENDIIDMAYALKKFIDSIAEYPHQSSIITTGMINCYIELRKKTRKIRGEYRFNDDEIALLELLRNACVYKNVDKKHKKFYLRIKLYHLDILFSRFKNSLIPSSYK